MFPIHLFGKLFEIYISISDFRFNYCAMCSVEWVEAKVIVRFYLYISKFEWNMMQFSLGFPAV